MSIAGSSQILLDISNTCHNLYSITISIFISLHSETTYIVPVYRMTCLFIPTFHWYSCLPTYLPLDRLS